MPENAAVNTGSGLIVATDEILVALTGTVAKTNGSATITGSGTAFLTELSVGMVISIPGGATERGVITAIASDTSLTLAATLSNTASGQTASRVVHYQLVKLIDATADSTSPIKLPTAFGQTTKLNSLPFVLPSDYQAPILPTNATPTVTNVSSNNADMVASMDVTNYRSGSFQASGFGSATVNVQFSNDGGTVWVSIPTVNILTGVSAVGITAAGIYHFAVPTVSLMRIRTTSYSSGTIAGSLVLSSLPTSLVPLAMQQDTGGVTKVSLFSAATINALGAANTGDSLANPFALTVNGFTDLYNESTWDRARGVLARTLLSSSARTTTTNSTDQTNYNWHGLLLTVDVTSAGTGSITPSIQVKDSISGNYKTIWTAAAALTANGTYVYALTIPAPAAASFTEAVAILLGRTWRLQMTHNNANSITYSASADMAL